ncbi:type II toxin-antitoxin system RelE/ParE family toxin [uncultured Parolsenella sp.]|uniref:type II toxin-antitoxin system RelE/ParE family toxin n=1 Tax=uncultured Parolsenella sp. TaxID=2083008 RepID=UPI0027D98131|nr:type II toxin-antitoxin system RelE/ParE family toxin [uncultured Parolsenella sp.]
MAYDVAISEPAESDRRIIVESLLEHGWTSAASSFLDHIDVIVNNLSRHPLMYPAAADARLESHGYRKAALPNYVLLYRVSEAGARVVIMRIFSQRQDYARLV